MDNRVLQIQNRTCRVYGTVGANTCCCKWRTSTTCRDEREAEACVANRTTVFAGRCPRGKLERRPVALVRTARVGQAGFGGRAEDTLAWLEQAVPSIRRQYSIKEDCKVVLGGYSLAGLFALWAATRTDTMYGVAAASPSVWFPGWPGYEAAHLSNAARLPQPW